jgi:F0F1-type ATP synthase assembly protein I
MKDLAQAVSIVFASSMIIGGIAGNRIAKYYGKSPLGGTIVGIGLGFVLLVGAVRLKGKIDMAKMQENQSSR